MAIEIVPTTGAAAGSAPRSGHRAAPGYRCVLLPRPDLPPRAQGVERAADSAQPLAETYRRAVLAGDAVVALITAVVPVVATGTTDGLATGVAMALPAAWLGVLALRGAYRRDAWRDRVRDPDPHDVGAAGALLVVAVICGAYLLDAAIPRVCLLLTGALLVAGSALVRRLASASMARARRRGRGILRLLVVGHPEPVARLIEALDAAAGRGLVAVGAVLRHDGDDRSAATPAYGVPSVADARDVQVVLEAAEELDVDAVVLGSDLDLSGWGVRLLLEGLDRAGTSGRQLFAHRGIGAASWAPRAWPVPGTGLVLVGERKPR